MAINDLGCNTESMQYFPQPSMPDSAYESTTPTYTIMQDDMYSNELHDHIIGAFKECLEEIDIKGKELFKKIISKGDIEISLGGLAREAIGESRAKDFLRNITTKVTTKMAAHNDQDFVVADRGANFDEEMSQKLERFKVKTVNIGGVIKEEQK